MGVLEILAMVGMAIGPPLAYGDQYISMIRRHDSRGYSTDISGILIVANLTRCFYWLGERFQLALLIQSILMIFAQFAILYVCLLYRYPNSHEEIQSLNPGLETYDPDGEEITTTPVTRRPLRLWQWEKFSSYLEFSALFVIAHTVFFVLLGSLDWYITILGFLALGMEATLPIPQALVNYERKSTAGFRQTVLLGWAIGDLVKTIYFFLTPDNSLAFKACAIFQFSVDLLICFQTFWYRKQTRVDLEARARLQGRDFEPDGIAGPHRAFKAVASDPNVIHVVHKVIGHHETESSGEPSNGVLKTPSKAQSFK